MQDPPSQDQLIEAIAAHLQGELLQAIDDRGLRFRTLIAANLLEILQRERELGPQQAGRERERLEQLLDVDAGAATLPELTRQLHARVAAGKFDRGPARAQLMAHLKATAVEKLRIANPKFLARLQAEDQARSGNPPAERAPKRE